MTPNVRIYANEADARKVDAALAEEGFDDRIVIVPSKRTGQKAAAVQEGEEKTSADEGKKAAAADKAPKDTSGDDGQDEAAVRAAIRSGHVPDRFEKICIRNLKAGCSLVGVRARFGSGGNAIEVMERTPTVDTDVLLSYPVSNPSPLSDAMRFSTLSEFVPISDLARSTWTFSSLFGMGLLSNKAAPLSSMFGMSVLSKPKADWNSSFGMPLKSDNPAPLSSMFGMSTLTRSKKDWTYSFGFPMLSRNPAPLSTLLGIKTLSDKDD